MATAIIMPRQGQSVESCIITAWNKKVGDTVEKGDILFSYETDKSSFDEPAPESGVLLAIFREEGDDVPCLENVCVIGQAGEDVSAFAPVAEAAPAEEAKAEAAPAAATVEAEVPAVATTAEAATGAISPRAKALAAKTGADLLKAAPTGPNGRIIERDVQSLLDRGLTVSAAAAAEYTSPIEGSGINGKVVLGDLNAPAAAAPVSADGTKVLAPMPGAILNVNVSVGASVKAGDVLMVLEAMKMENDIVAPCDGVVKQIPVSKGSTVNTDDVLAVL